MANALPTSPQTRFFDTVAAYAGRIYDKALRHGLGVADEELFEEISLGDEDMSDRVRALTSGVLLYGGLGGDTRRSITISGVTNEWVVLSSVLLPPTTTDYARYREVTVQVPCSDITGVIGTYRHAVARRDGVDFSYVEESRIIVSRTMYHNNLCVGLATVVAFRASTALCDPSNVVWLMATESGDIIRWTRVIRAGVHAGGVDFLSRAPPIMRTSVYNGKYIEKNGRKAQHTTMGLLPDYIARLILRDE